MRKCECAVCASLAHFDRSIFRLFVFSSSTNRTTAFIICRRNAFVYSYLKKMTFLFCAFMLPVKIVDAQIDTSHNAILNCDLIEVDKRYKLAFNAAKRENEHNCALRSTLWLERELEQILMIKNELTKVEMKTTNSNGTHLHKRRDEEERKKTRHNNRTETCVSVSNCMKQCKNRIDPSSQFLIIESCFSFVINDAASEKETQNILAWSC